MGFGVFVMVRRQLLGIKERAEITAVAPPVERPEITVAADARPSQRQVGRTRDRDGGRGRRNLSPGERGHGPGRSIPTVPGRAAWASMP